MCILFPVAKERVSCCREMSYMLQKCYKLLSPTFRSQFSAFQVFIESILRPYFLLADGLISSGYAGGRPQSRLCACPRGWMESMSISRFKSGSRIGVTASMRRYRFRRIQSGEPRKSFGFPPLPKYHTRACSRNVSTIRVTRMLRLYFRPGMRQQIPRTIRSIKLRPARLRTGGLSWWGLAGRSF